MFQLFRSAVMLARQQRGLYFAALLEEQLIREVFDSASLIRQACFGKVGSTRLA